jgi:hypothetical protein
MLDLHFELDLASMRKSVVFFERKMNGDPQNKVIYFMLL